MKFFRPAEIRTQTGWDEACAAYDNYLLKVLPKLPPAWRQLAEIEFHDRCLIGTEKPNRSELLLRIGTPKRFWTLHFIDVRHARIANTAIGDFWLYTEVHLTNDGNGALQVLLTKSELRVVAGNLGISQNFEGPVW